MIFAKPQKNLQSFKSIYKRTVINKKIRQRHNSNPGGCCEMFQCTNAKNVFEIIDIQLCGLLK